MKLAKLLGYSLGAGLTFLGFSLPANAVQIDFTGGTVTQNNSSTQTTNNSVLWNNVDYYEEDGFKLDFISSGSNSSDGFIGNYYGVGNDVVHGHWQTGGLGTTLTQIKVTKLDNTAFDLNYFVLTSNTHQGGGLASGNERVTIHASIDGTTSSYSQVLTPENWGFPASQIFLGSQFDNIKAFWFTAENDVDCFGMDSFYINEAAPGNPSAVPEPTVTIGLLAIGILGAALTRKRNLG
jgi:PEP-CTERM motif